MSGSDRFQKCDSLSFDDRLPFAQDSTLESDIEVKNFAMKRLLLIALLVMALVGTIPTPAALAADGADGAKVFTTNCAACHIGGGNVVNGAKTLKKAALEQYQMDSLKAIQSQVLNGKNAMPAFKGRLTEAQIENVASYVLSQAEKGW